MAPSISEKIIEVQDLHKSYGSLKAVEGVSFDINAGEVFGILGLTGTANQLATFTSPAYNAVSQLRH